LQLDRLYQRIIDLDALVDAVGLKTAGNRGHPLEHVPIDWNRRLNCGAGRRRPVISFGKLPEASEKFVRSSKSFQKRSISFQLLPKISPLPYIFQRLPIEFASLPAERLNR